MVTIVIKWSDATCSNNKFFIITCWANSLVGARIKAWQSLMFKSNCCRIAIENVAVLPVPDWAWAITSLPK